MNGLPALPPPAELAELLSAGGAAKRSASYLPADLFMEAEDFAPLLPSQNVSADSNGLSFSPDFGGSAADFSGLSFAMFGFRIDDYGGDNTLHYSWHGAAPPAGRAYLALADWVSGRWVMRELPSASPLALPPLSPFFDGDNTLVAAVILTGNQSFELDWLRIGSLPPQVTLSVDKASGLIPFNVTLSASATDLDGSVAEYLWDPEGSGNFDISTGSEPQLSHVYETAGEFVAAVRAVDNKGVYAGASAELESKAQLSLVSGTSEQLEFAGNTIALPDGELFSVGGQVSSDFEVRRAVVSRITLDGEIRFAKLWGNGGEDGLSRGVTGPEGFIYACGQTTANGQMDGLLQKWSADGELLWSRSYGLIDAAEELRAITVTSDAIYACGSLRLDANFKYLGFVLRTDLAGNLVWATTVIAPGFCFLQDTAYRSASSFDPGFLTVCGGYEVSSVDNDVLFATLNEATGSVQQAQRWGSSTADEQANCISIGTGAVIKPIFVSGMLLGSNDCFIGRPGGAMQIFEIADFVSLTGVDLLGQTLLATGNIFDFLQMETYRRPVVLRFDSQLNILSCSMSSGGDFFASGLTRYDANNLILSGQDNFSSQAIFIDAQPTSSASPIPWGDLFPSVGSPQIQVLDTALTTFNAPGWQLDPGGSEENMAVCLGAF